MEFSIKMEIVSLVILLILFMYHLDRQNSNNTRYRLFTASLALAVVTILFNIASTAAMDTDHMVPMWAQIVLNTLYFISLDMTFSVMAVYCFYILFEYSVDRHCFKIASGITCAFAVLLFMLNLLNLHTGWIFTFENGFYERGPINRIGFVPLFIEVGMFCACYMRNKKVIGSSMKRLVQTLPTLVFLITVVQIMIPNLMLTGLLSALVCMVLFINFQSSRNGRDALTGLPGRTYFTKEIRARRKRGECVHLIMIHLDKFEEVNKKYGVQMGDSVLFSTAGFLEQQFSGYQTCRFGNTTFLMMAKSAGKKMDIQCVNKLKARFDVPWIQGDKEVLLRVSIAHRKADFVGYNENGAIDQLEYALSCVRENGGNGVICFDEDLQKRYLRQEYVLEEVKRAIKKKSFEVYFQPIYNSKENMFDTAESLLRLKDRGGKFISPGEFIPLAEKHGLMDEISWQVLDQVCGFLGKNRNTGLQQVSINMPVGQLLDPDFPDRIDRTCEKYQADAGKLRIEITERVMAEEPERVREVMKLLSEKGVKFYLDDFGIGYSNLSMVMELPFETVKLDSSLVLKMTNGEREYHTIRLLVEMLHNSGFHVVAEGIEHVEEMQAARRLQIDRIQGFYYAKPMPSGEIVRFMKERSGNPKKES